MHNARLGTTVLTAIFVLLTAASDAAAQARGEIGIALGETPELPQIEDLDGNPVSLADFAGDKPVLVEFWALWCSDCEKLHPRLAAAHEAYGDRVEFVAVGVGINQNPRRMKRHLDGMDPPVEWPTYYDRRGAAARAFLAPTTSYIVILDRSGRVVYANVGPNQNIDGAIRSALGAPDGPE